MLIVWFFAYKKLAQFAVRGALPLRRSESPGLRNRRTLLRVASAGLVYWVAWFFLLGMKAQILGLTFGGSCGIGKASDPIPTPAGGKSGRH